MILTSKQEQFAFNIAVNGMNYTDAYRNADYAVSKLTDNTLWVASSRLASNSKVKLRITELQDELNGPDILSRREYLAGLTKIARTKLTDFQTCGADGASYIDIGSEHPHAGSVAEIVSKTEYDKDGSNAAVITKIKLHDPMQAGRDIAKVKGWLQSQPEGGNTTNVYVNRVEIHNNRQGEKRPFKELKDITEAPTIDESGVEEEKQ